ncbi:TRAP transporter small permease [Corynebacterium anserum]|uniref:TRAP transporter small permease subunit n=1 Tax=Corynebacterium anserum TaxID=2684406 RepID=A0A7G7YLT6_9CORY|nr:TRAP transporter small permease [Corynebacterium anserum]MBC2681379.1 TRAP transporter small permease subunit [Corynebacterium anserum]QNH95456.1 TRAP transporter small permease subunit [Corynebacterium anserum]
MPAKTFVHPDHHGTAERSRFGYHTTDHPFLDKIQNMVSALAAWIAGAAIIGLTTITLVEIAMREFFGSPLGWNISLTEKYMLPLIAFFGLVTAYRTGSHIAVQSLFGIFPKRVQKIILIAIHLIVFISLTFMILGGWNETVMAHSMGHATLPGMADLPTPDWTYRAIVPVAALMCAIIAAIDLFRELITPWHRPFTDYDPGEEEV